MFDIEQIDIDDFVQEDVLTQDAFFNKTARAASTAKDVTKKALSNAKQTADTVKDKLTPVNTVVFPAEHFERICKNAENLLDRIKRLIKATEEERKRIGDWENNRGFMDKLDEIRYASKPMEQINEAIHQMKVLEKRYAGSFASNAIFLKKPKATVLIKRLRDDGKQLFEYTIKTLEHIKFPMLDSLRHDPVKILQSKKFAAEVKETSETLSFLRTERLKQQATHLNTLRAMFAEDYGDPCNESYVDEEIFEESFMNKFADIRRMDNVIDILNEAKEALSKIGHYKDDDIVEKVLDATRYNLKGLKDFKKEYAHKWYKMSTSSSADKVMKEFNIRMDSVINNYEYYINEIQKIADDKPSGPWRTVKEDLTQKLDSCITKIAGYEASVVEKTGNRARGFIEYTDDTDDSSEDD